MSTGILLVSHIEEVASGLKRLIREVAKDVVILDAGGLEDGGVGTSIDRINAAIDSTDVDTLMAFYDLGSAKMNLEMAADFSDKKIKLYDTAFIESAYTAAALLQAGSSIEDIEAQLAPMKVK